MCVCGLTAGREFHNGRDYFQRHNVRDDLPAAESNNGPDGQQCGQGPASEAASVGHLPQDHGGEAASKNDVDRVARRHDDHQRQSSHPVGSVRLGSEQSTSYTGTYG